MKTIKRLVLAFVILLLTGCSLIFKTIDYKVDTTEFKNVVAYQEEVDIAGLKIVETINGTATKIPVDKSMVTSCDPTSSLGDKTLTLTYKEKTFTVKFTVKYRVNFTSGSEVLYTQYVTKASEIHAPNDPYKPGYEFDGWSPEIPNAINDNMTFEAEFRDTPKEIPNLATSYDAVYGDTLADIDLPSNIYGKWEFVDSLSTPVGNVGKNTFNVQFTPTNVELTVVKSTAVVYVSKMHLDFNFTKLQIDYDGLEHIPEYTLVNSKGEVVNDPAITVNYTGQKGKDVGTYFYAYTINSANYEGNAMGYFDIVANRVTITIADSSMNLGETVPNFTLVSSKEDLKPFTYYVEGVDPSVIPLLNIQISVPKINNAGEYTLSASVNNENYKDVVVNKAKLTVNKLVLGAADLTITTNPVYGEKLETVIIADDNPNGYWAWVDGNVILDHAGEFEADAVFTPYSQNYELEYKTFKINVAKRVLDISITDDENNPNDGYQYVYDGLEHTITYKVEGFVLNDTIEDIEVIGNVKGINAGNISSKLEIVSLNYEGSLAVTLVIKKAIPVTDFTTVFDNVLLNSKLEDISLPEGYRWDVGSEVLDVLGENQKFPVTYTPADTLNYEVVRGEFTVNVIKHTPTITAKDLYTFKYNGEVHTLTGVRASHTESELVYKYFLNGQEIENIRNAGEYRVVITLPESPTYYEKVIEVVAIVETIGVSPEPSVFDATYGDTLGSILLPTSEYGAWSWKDGDDTLVGDAGNNIHVAVFTSSNPNYKSYEVEVKVVVAKKTLNFVVDESKNIFDYDTQAHKVTFELEGIFDYDLSKEINVLNKDTSYTDVGNYLINLVIDDENYRGNKQVSLVINKVDPVVSNPLLGENGEIIWGTRAFEYNSLLDEGFMFKENYLFDTVGVDLEYTLIYTPSDTRNYNTIEVTSYITVSRATPTITYREVTPTYNGKAVTLNASTSNTDGVTLEYSYKLNGVEVSEIKDAGTYEVVITSPASTNYEEVTKTVSVTVNKKAVSVIWHINSSYTYSVNGQALPTAEFVNVNGGYVDLDVVFEDVLNEENEEFKNASTYKFSAVVDDYTNNYEFSGIESEEVVINKATIDTSSASWNHNGFSYDGKEHTVQLINITLPSDVKANYTNNKATNAGNYTAEVSFVYDANNYNEITVSKPTHDWKITATGLVVVWENTENKIYTGSEFEYPTAYINGVSGRVDLDIEMDKTTFKDAGEYKFKAIDTTGNYELIDDECSIVVSAKSIAVVWDDQEDRTYNGEELAYPSATVETVEGIVELTPTILYGGSEFKLVNKYKFIVTYDNPNYTITNVESSEIEILKATYDMSGAKWDYEEAFTYGNVAHSVKVEGLPTGVSVKSYSNNEKVDAGTYKASAELEYDEANYNEVSIEDLTWTINPLEVTVTWADSEDRVYENKQFSYPTASFTDLKDNEVLLIISEQNNKVFRNAGVYTFLATFESTYVDKANYVIINTEEVEILKATLDAPELEATYGDELGEIQIPSSTYGEWALASGTNVLDKVGDKGTQVVYLDFTSSDDNYNSLTNVAASVEVKAKAITGSIEANGGSYGDVEAAEATLSGVELNDTVEVTLTYTGTANDGTIYNSTEVPTKAGTYTVTATITNTNYSLAETSETFVIAKADPATYFNSVVFDAAWNSTLQDIDLSAVTKEVDGSYAFVYPETTLTSVGDGQVFEAKFIPSDTYNYNEVDGAFVVDVLGGLDSSITANDTYTFVYDGEAQEVNASGSHSEVELQYVYKLNGVEVASMINAGTYEVVITLPATEHYSKATKTVTVTITKAVVDVEWSIQPSYTYSAAGQVLPKAYVQKVDGSYVELNVKEANDKPFKNVDVYTFEASLTAALEDNYELGNNIVSENVAISKATINLTSSKWNYTNAFTYTGAAQSVAVVVSLPSDVTINYVNNSKTDAGTYIASAELNYESNNYDVEGSLPADLTWTINPKAATVVWENDADRDFKAAAYEYPTAYINGVSGRVDLTVAMTDERAFRNAGDYVFTASDESNNYALSNIENVITIKRVSLNVNYELGSYGYSGSELEHPRAYVVDLNENEIDLVTTIISGEPSFMNAGDYMFAAAFGDYLEKDNYTLDNVNSSIVTIAKATLDMKDAKWNYEEAFTYNKSAHSVEVLGLPTGVSVDSYTGTTSATDADTYTADVVLSYDSANYDLINNNLQELTWTIKPKEIEVVWSTGNYSYTGNNLPYPTATYPGVEIAVNRGFEGLFKDAGNYSFTASTENTNYTIKNPIEIYVVNKKVLDLPTGLEATYGQTLGSVSLPISPFGTWSFDNTSASVGNAGNNSFAISFTSTDNNYASFDSVVVVTVKAKAITVTITPNGGTYGETITDAEATASGYIGEVAPTITLTYTGTANDGTAYNSTTAPTKAGTYKVTATITDKNYSLASTSDTFVVERASATITNNLADSSDYSGSEVDVESAFELSHEESQLSFDISGKASVVKDAGTYYIVVSADQSANYKAASLDAITYTVNKVDPTLSYKGQTNYTYSSDSSYTISDNDIETDNDDTGYEITTVIKLNGSPVDVIHEAGTYSVYITISATTNYNEKTIDFTILVEKGSINLDDIADIPATYGQKLGDFSLPEANDGVWSWEEGNEVAVGDVGNRTHIAVFKPTDTSIADVEKSVTFIVSPKTITITVTSGTTFEYNGEEKEITYSLSETPSGVSVSVSGENKGTIVGNYSTTFTITGNDNYKGSKSVNWSITKATPTYTAPTGLQATYLDKLSSVGLPDGWAWVDTNPDTEVGAAGTRTHQATYTPADTHNYNTVTIGLAVEVAKKEYTPTVAGTAASATYGDKLSSVSLEGEDSYGKWIWANPNSYVGNKGTNTHEIVFDLFDKENYYVASGSTADVTVNALDITVTITSIGGTYNGTITAASAQPVGFVVGFEPTVTLTYTGEANDGLPYDGMPTHAGEYTVTASITDTNYNLTGVVSAGFSVKKAKPSGLFSAATTSFEYGRDLGSLGLAFSSTVPGTATWDDGNATKPEVTNGTAYPVTFTPNDTNNYETVDGTVTLIVSKITTSITTESNSYTFTYGDYDNFLSVLGTTLTPSNNEQTVKFYDGLEEVTSISDAGTYSIVIKVDETNHYKASSTSVTIVVNKKEEAVEMDDEFEYGSTMDHVEDSVKESEFGTFTLYESDPNEAQASLLSTYRPLLGAANSTKVVWVSFVPYPEYEKNYKAHIKQIIITIIKKNITVNINSDAGFYGNVQEATATLTGILSGEENDVKLTLTYTGTANDGEVYDSEVAPTKAGKYTVTASIEADNYFLTGVVSDDFIIQKATPSVVEHTFEQYWNESLEDVSLDSMVAKDPTSNVALAGSFAWNAKETVLETVGDNQTFLATFTPTDVNNYEVVDNVEFKVDVNRIETTVRYEGLSDLVYAPSKVVEVTPIVNHSEATPVVEILYGKNEEPVDNLTNAGSYKVTVTIAETEHYTAYNGETFVVEVAKATPATNFAAQAKVVKWSDNLKLQDLALLPGYAWDSPTTDLDNIETKSYNVTFTPEDTVNYLEVNDVVSVTVNKADATVTANDLYTFTYKGSEYTIDDLTGITTNHSESEAFIDVTLLDADEYEVTITLPESAHYNKATTTTTVVINKASEPAPDKLTGSYGDILGAITLPTSTNGTWTLAESMDADEVYDAGEHDVVLRFTANTTNYETKDYTVKLIISPVAYEPTSTPSASATYGDKLSAVQFVGGDNTGTWSWKDTNETTLVGNAGTQEHVAVFTPTSGNYLPSEHVISVSVAKKQVTIKVVKDTFDFNGNKRYVSYNLEGVLDGDDEPIVTGNTGWRNVDETGTAYVLVIDDTNYEGSVSGTITIKKVDPTVNFESVVGLGTYGQPLSTVELPAGFTFDQPTTIMDTVGEKEYAVTYTHPEEAANYNTVNGMITVVAGKATYDMSGVEWNYEGPFTYNGNPKEVLIVSGLPSGVTVKAYQNNIKTDVGEYEATVSFNYDSDHYEEPTIDPLSWKINPTRVAIELEDEYVYGSTLKDIVPKASDYGTFSVINKNGNTDETALLGNAGDKVTVIVTFTSTNKNYESYYDEVEFTIAKREVTFNNVVSVYDYDGEAHTVTYTLGNVVGNDTPTVTGNTSIVTVAQSTEVTLVVEDPNYKGSITVELTINKGTPSTDFTKVYTVENGKKLSDIALDEGYSWKNGNLSLTTVADGQKFDAIYTPDDTANYKVVSGQFTVNVTKIINKVTINSNDWTGKTYNTESYTVEAELTSGDNPTITIGYNESTTAGKDDQYVSKDKLLDAGTYKITVTADETETYSAVNETYYVVIAQAKQAAFDKSYEIDWREGLTLSNVPSEGSLPSGYAWKDNTTSLNEIGTKAYAVVYTPTDRVNYMVEEGTFNVTVNKADAGQITADTNYSLGEYKEEGYTIADLHNVVYPHSESTPYINVTLKDAKSYEVTITLPESTHYLEKTITINVWIDKKMLSKPTGLQATYGDTLVDVELPTSEFGEWVFVNDGSTSVGNAGTQTFAIKFIPSNPNYGEVSENVDINVLQQVTSVTPNIPTLTYSESEDYTEQEIKAWFETNSDAEIAVEVKKGDTPYTTIKDAGTYTISLSINESTNFTAFSNVYSVTIKQATYTGALSVPNDLKATYGDTLADVELPTGWTWASSSDSVGNAGDRSHTAQYTHSANYLPKDATLTISVAKKKVTITILNQNGEENGSTTVTYEYSGSTQYVLYEVEGLLEGDSITVNGNNGWKNVSDSGAYTLSINDDNYYATSVSGNIIILQTEPTLTLPTFENDIFYEDRLEEVDLTKRATAMNMKTNKLVAGTFSYEDPTFETETNKEQIVHITVTFTPKDSVNYKVVTGNIDIKLSAVAYIGSTYYGTVEEALAAATNGETVYIIPGTNPILKEDATINAGVTLMVQYAEGATNSKKGTRNDGIYTSFFGQVTSELTIAEGKILTNYGTLEVGGIISGGGGGADAVGHTVESYAQITLRNNSKIILEGGAINCFGYIIEETDDNGSEIILNSGTLEMPFILRDFKGGSQTYGIYNKFDTHKYAAFEQYELRNIQAKLTAKYNSKIIGWGNIYAGSQQNYTSINLVGNEDGYLIKFNTTNSYLVANGDFITVLDTFNNNNPREVYKLDLDFYGGIDLNSLVLNITVFLSPMEVSTEKVYFSVTYATDISFNKIPGGPDAVYNLNQRLKFMTGSKMSIGEGVTVNASSIYIYESYNPDFSTLSNLSMARYYPSNLPSAEFFVSGKIVVEEIAGPVLLQKDKGEIEAESTGPITIYDAKERSDGTLSDPVEDWFVQSDTLRTKDFIKINKVVDSQVTTEEFVLDGSLYTPEAISKDGYTFNGWYVGDNLWSEVYPSGIDEDTTLEARFTLNHYDINYDLYNYQEGSSGTQDAVVTYNETLDSFTIEDGLVIFDTPTHSEGHTLKGLYINSVNGEPIPVVNVDGQRVYAIEAAELYKYLENGSITVYAIWYQNPLTIEFVNTNYDEQVLDLYHWSIEQNNVGGGTVNVPSTLSYINSYVLPEFGQYNDDESYSMYFVGWKYNGNIISNLSFTQEQLNTIMNSEEKKVVLEAVWEDKIEISINVGDDAPLGYTFNGLLYNQICYVHSSKLDSFTFYEDTSFATGNTNVNQQKYFTGWVSNGEPLNGMYLTLDQKLFGIDTGFININSNWINKYIVSFKYETGDYRGYSMNTKDVYGLYDTPMIDLPDVKTGYNFVSWDNGKLPGELVNITGNTTLTAVYSVKKINVNLSAVDGTQIKINNTFIVGSTNDQDGQAATGSQVYDYGTSFTLVIYVNSNVDNPKYLINGETKANLSKGKDNNIGTYTIGQDGEGDVTISTSSTGGCVAAGTLVTMADGTTKKVEDIQAGDEVLVFNHVTGTYDISKVVVNVHNELEWAYYDVMNLVFSNGTTLRIINEHSLFDLDLNKYVVFTVDSYQEYLGHRFYSATYKDGKYVEEIITLENFYITREFTGMYNPITEVHLNIFTEGLLSLPGEVRGFMNMFAFDSDLKYNEELMMQDIATYGLYSYEELSPYISKELYDILPSPYLKVAVGKGMIPFEDLLRLRDLYYNKYGIY